MKRQSKFFGEFKKFILRGNVMDMAVGVIVGGAFTSIVTSLNADILTPILGIFGGTDFSYLTVTLGTGENAPVLHYGNFITAVINFLITAFVIFIMLKVINRITEKLSIRRTEARLRRPHPRREAGLLAGRRGPGATCAVPLSARAWYRG